MSERNPQGAVSLSPDGKTYVVRLVHGDAKNNGAWVQIISGNATSLRDAAKWHVIDERMTTGLGAGDGRAGSEQDTSPGESPLHWIDSDNVAFLWSDSRGVRQVASVDIKHGNHRMLSSHPTALISFDMASDGTLIYCAQTPDVPSQTERKLREGFVLDPHADVPSLMLGRIDDMTMIERLWNAEWFLQRPGKSAERMRIAGRDVALSPNQLAKLSPSARLAIISTNAPVVSEQWERYQDDDLRRTVGAARTHPENMLGRLVNQLWVFNTVSGESHALWDAPTTIDGVQIAWSTSEREVLVAPAFLPSPGVSGPEPKSVAAAIVDVSTGDYQTLPVESDAYVNAARWLDTDRVEVRLRVNGVPDVQRFLRSNGRWIPEKMTVDRRSLRFELRQTLNDPPVLYATSPASGTSVEILNPNPGLTKGGALGHAERIEGVIDSKAAWQGILFYPPHFMKGQRYPLVIQSVYGQTIADEFSLYGDQGGDGLGPSLLSPYVGRMLSTRDVLVLHLTVSGDFQMQTQEEPEIRTRAFEAAAKRMIELGIADPDRIGIAGFSRNGYYVEYALTHSAFKYAAALSADNWDASYTAQTLLGYVGGAEVNGGPPFGAGLTAWLDRAPGFRADAVHTPLLKIEQSHALLGILVRWELYSRLRYLNKPVELYVVPNAQKGVHNTQNPEQLMAVQERTIDWFLYWLADRVDEDSGKHQQYERWAILREQQNTPVPVAVQ